MGDFFSSKLERAAAISRLLRARRYLRRAGVGRAERIWSSTPRVELAVLFTLAAELPSNAAALEIGSYHGASSCFLAAGLARHGGRLICVDTWQNETMGEGESDTFATFQQNIAGLRTKVETIRKSSLDLVDSDLPEELDFVFLDGDHSYDAVHSDMKLIGPHVVPNGIVAFHDAQTFQGVARTIGEVLATGEWRIGGTFQNLFWIRKAAFPKND